MLNANEFLEKALHHADARCKELGQESKSWEEHVAREKKLKVWQKLQQVLEDGMDTVNYCAEEDIALYRRVSDELEYAKNKMREFQLFLPYKPLEERARLALPRLAQGGMIATGKEYVPTQTDEEVAAEGWGWLPEPIELHVGEYDSDEESVAAASS